MTRSRLSPSERRAQLLDLGVRLLATRPVDELSIDLLAEEAGVSRGLLYHYFGGKQAFREAVVRRAADELVARTAPPADGDAVERLLASMSAYVDYVVGNHEGYLSLVTAAAGGSATLRRIYLDARATLTDRLFAGNGEEALLEDTALNRLVVRGWAAMTEALVLGWIEAPAGVTREQLLAVMTESLLRLVGPGPGGP